MTGDDLIIKYFGIIFIIASLVRYYIPTNRYDELDNMGLPHNIDIFIVVFEFAIGFILLFDLYDTIHVLSILLLLLIIGIILIMYNNFNKIMNEFHTVWFYQPSAMSVVLHCTYIFITIFIIMILLNKKS